MSEVIHYHCLLKLLLGTLRKKSIVWGQGKEAGKLSKPIYSKIAKQEQIMVFSNLYNFKTYARELLDNSRFQKIAWYFSICELSRTYSRKCFFKDFCHVFAVPSYDIIFTCSKHSYLKWDNPFLPFTFCLLHLVFGLAQAHTHRQAMNLQVGIYESERALLRDWDARGRMIRQPTCKTRVDISNTSQNILWRHQPFKPTHNLMNLFPENYSSLNSKFSI